MPEISVLLVVGLLSALGASVWWHRRTRMSLQSQLHNATAEMSMAELRHSAALAETRAAHERAIAVQRAGYREIRKRLQLSAGERTSREHILAACQEEGIDAIILSNVLFRPEDSSGDSVFHAQVDHLVVTASSVMIVESKYWQNVVFDGMDFRQESEALRVLFGDLVPEGPRHCAVHFIREDDRVSFRTSSPAGQARRQAQRLSGHLKARGIPTPWIHTCVYYCHPRGLVKHADSNEQTVIVSTPAALRKEISRAQYGRAADVDVRSIVDALAPVSTDTTGVGVYSRRWPNRLDAQPTLEQVKASTS